MGKRDPDMIRGIGENVERFAGKEARDKVMEGSEKISPGTSKKKIAEWVKEAISKLDKLADKKVSSEIMENCGYNCSIINKRVIEKARARCNKYRDIEKFLEAELSNPMLGTRLERKGNVLHQFYTPGSYSTPMRCYCSLLRGLPDDQKVSITYCNCSKGFVKKFWEGVLERTVKVELIKSAVSGAQECEFAIYL
jgi:predicted hydrocarbon binding protein